MLSEHLRSRDAHTRFIPRRPKKRGSGTDLDSGRIRDLTHCETRSPIQHQRPKRVTVEEWDSHKARIEKLYLRDGLSLAKVMRILERGNFHASVKQYKAQFVRWGFHKNLTSKDMQAMIRIRDRRRTVDGKDTKFMFRDERVSGVKIDRWQKRNEVRPDSYGTECATPPELKYDTPSPDAQFEASDYEHDHVCTSMMSLNLSDNGDAAKMPTASSETTGQRIVAQLMPDAQSVKTVRQSFTDSWLRDGKPLESGQSTTDADSVDSLLSLKSGPSTIAEPTISDVPVCRPDNTKLACPFAVRNPMRFNIREHKACVLSGFESITTLKAHIRRSHCPPTCQRCQQTFSDGQALRNHICRACMPEPSPIDPENGVTVEVESLLTARKLETKLDNWESIYKVLFPNDKIIPSPEFRPPIEIGEVGMFLSRALDGLQDQFRQLLQQRVPDAETLAESIITTLKDSSISYVEKCRQKHHQAPPQGRFLALQEPRPQNANLVLPPNSTLVDSLTTQWETTDGYQVHQDISTMLNLGATQHTAPNHNTQAANTIPIPSSTMQPVPFISSYQLASDLLPSHSSMPPFGFIDPVVSSMGFDPTNCTNDQCLSGADYWDNPLPDEESSTPLLLPLTQGSYNM